jgi:phospholipid/cholesterol/gamma-HCH transport system permease protein
MVLRALGQTGSILLFGGTVVKSAVRNPRGYWAETSVQFYSSLRLVAIPMVVSLVAFGLGAPGIQGGNIENIFGIPEQLGSFFVMASIREFAPWIDAMVVAGVVGTAITADLGARRIREELDALQVLGLDPIRELVIPRVLATTFLTGLCDIAGVLIGAIGGYIAAVPLLGAATGPFFHDFFVNASATDLWGSVVKTTIFGLVIGVVCSFKGLRAEGGPAGVGRAVNQAVVASFALIWVINYVFTDILLGTHPGIQVIK